MSSLPHAASLAACGNDDGKETTAPSNSEPAAKTQDVSVEPPSNIDPCGLITAEEVESIVGNPVQAGQPDESNIGWLVYTCTYEEQFDRQRTGDRYSIVVQIDAHSSADTASRGYDLKAGDWPKIENLGDRARNVQPLDDLEMLYGRYILTIKLTEVNASGDDDFELDAATQIARKVLERLP